MGEKYDVDTLIARLRADRDRLAAEVERLRDEVTEHEDLGIQADYRAQVEMLEDQLDTERARADAAEARLEAVREWADGKPTYAYGNANTAFRDAQDEVRAILAAAPAPDSPGVNAWERTHGAMPDLPDGFPRDPAPEWSAEPPTAPGWYWMRYEGMPGAYSGIRPKNMDIVTDVEARQLRDIGGQWWPVPLTPPGGDDE